MKVHELIKYLQTQDQEAEVGFDRFDGDYTDWFTFEPNQNSAAIPGYLDLMPEKSPG